MINIEVIVTTYNNPLALNFVLVGLSKQNINSFRICIADDGSSESTLEIVDIWRQKFGSNRFRHVWHPDNGFAKNQILNKAISSSSSDYLIFIDGDCIPHPDFLLAHIECANINRFLSGGVVRLPSSTSAMISEHLISTGEVFSKRWLFSNDVTNSMSNLLKLSLTNKKLSNLLNHYSPVKTTWNGGNSSTWRKHLLAVNGFDESLSYGAEDIELGYRLNNLGIRGFHVRYSALLLHLDHPRSYANAEVSMNNRIFAKKIQQSKISSTINGIIKK